MGPIQLSKCPVFGPTLPFGPPDLGSRPRRTPPSHLEKTTRMPNQNGFTLIELLIVLVIIGILTAIAVPQFSETREKAFFAAMKADARNLANQQELYYTDNYSYSSDLSALDFVSSEGVTASPTGTTSGWSATITHDALGDEEGCAIYYGTVTDKPTIGGKTPEAEGQIACTG